MMIIPKSWYKSLKTRLAYLDHAMNHDDHAKKHGRHAVIMALSLSCSAMTMI